MTARRLMVLMLLTLIPAGACSGSPAPEPVPPEAWHVDDFLYQLQRANAERIGETAFDLVVTSIDITGSSPDTIPALQHSPGGDKTVLAYLSIGQAEDYRFYWDDDWKTNPPSWLDEPDHDWRGDYWVRYWDPGWKAIIYGSPEAYLDRIIDLGFDGIYLDRVDTYQFFEERDGRTTAAREMADFVIELAEYARERRPGFGVFPQNAEELGPMFDDYLETVTGIGVEDLYYGGVADHEPTPASWTAEREAVLATWVNAGKLVLTIDYTAKPEQISDAYRRSIDHGFVPYVTDRSLGRIRINPGFEPDRNPDDYEYHHEGASP